MESSELSSYISLARADGEVVVTGRGKPVVRLVPIEPVLERSDENVLAEPADAGLVELGRKPRRAARLVVPRRISISDVVPSRAGVALSMDSSKGKPVSLCRARKRRRGTAGSSSKARARGESSSRIDRPGPL